MGKDIYFFEENIKYMVENNKFVRWVTRNSSNKHFMISFLKFVSFCLSSIIGLLIIDFTNTNISNALFLFAIPITFNLGIEIVQAFRSSKKGIILIIVLSILFLVYGFLSFLGLLGVFSEVKFIDSLLKNRGILTPLVLSYSYFYFLEIILLFIKDLVVKYYKDKAELAKPIKVVGDNFDDE